MLQITCQVVTTHACHHRRTQKSHTNVKWKIEEWNTTTRAPLLHNIIHFASFLSLNSNRDSGVISYTMLFLQRRGLTVFLPATSAGGPFWPASHCKRHRLGSLGVPFPARLAVGSSCTTKMWIWQCPFTFPLDHEYCGCAGRIGHIPDSPRASESHSGQTPSYRSRPYCRLTVLCARRLACLKQPPEATRSSNPGVLLCPILSSNHADSCIALRSTPCSRAMLYIPIACCAALHAGCSSASPELRSDLCSNCAGDGVLSASFSCPITVTLDNHFRGCFLSSKHDPNVWRSFQLSSDTFQLQPVISCWFCSGLGTHSYSVL